jgi:hypothetical protein
LLGRLAVEREFDWWAGLRRAGMAKEIQARENKRDVQVVVYTRIVVICCFVVYGVWRGARCGWVRRVKREGGAAIDDGRMGPSDNGHNVG